MRTVRLQIHGRVQGVWYRASTRSEAERLGVHGWVRNRSDGTVEALVQGDAGAVEELVAWCRRGPSGAAVSRVDVSEVDGGDIPAGFQIR